MGKCRKIKKSRRMGRSRNLERKNTKRIGEVKYINITRLNENVLFVCIDADVCNH